MADNNKYIQAQKFRLSGSGISSSAVSITLQTFNLLDGTAITSSNIGSVAFGTLESGTSKEEQISFTGITDNGNGTFTLTGVTRGLRFVAPYDEVSANKFSHAGGSIFVLSNTAGFYDRFAAKDNEETINQVWTFGVTPKSTAGSPTISTELVTKAYADALAIAGSPDSDTTTKGIGRVSVAPASAATPIFVGDNDARVPTADENNALVGNNGAPSSTNKYITQTGLQIGAEAYAADAGANDTYAITLSPVPSAYVTGMVINFKANTVNTGASTLNVNSLGAKTIKKANNQDLADGDIESGQIVTLIYDGTNFQMQSQVGNILSVDIQLFTTSGTWTKPTGAKKVQVEAWGGGGSGSKSNAGSGGAGGGGGGEYRTAWFGASSLGSSETITIGTGGIVISATGTNGDIGVASTFGSLLTANGGEGGQQNSPASDGTGGAGGNPHVPLTGMWGGEGVEITGVAGLYSAGGGGATSASTGYAGGASTFGGGGGGGASSTVGSGGVSKYGGAGSAGVNSGSATAGTQPSGGGGASRSAGDSGAGGAGQILVTTFF